MRALAERTGRRQSELIREAIDQYVARGPDLEYGELVQHGAGIWRDRTDLPDFDEVRREFDRYAHG